MEAGIIVSGWYYWYHLPVGEEIKQIKQVNLF